MTRPMIEILTKKGYILHDEASDKKPYQKGYKSHDETSNINPYQKGYKSHKWPKNDIKSSQGEYQWQKEQVMPLSKYKRRGVTKLSVPSLMQHPHSMEEQILNE